MDGTLVDLCGVTVDYVAQRSPRQVTRHLVDKLKIGGRIHSNASGTFVRSLSDVSLKVGPGERVGIVGVNGAGKSTLLKVISGVLPPRQGRVHVRGRCCSMLSLAAGVDAELTGYENLYLRCIYERLPLAQLEEFAEDVINFTQLGAFFDQPVKTYSDGMRARLLLAISTLRAPDVLLMDEWVGAGDGSFREKANARLRRFVTNSGCLIMATHSQSLLEQWCDTLIWVHMGQIIRHGPRQEVWDDYYGYVARAAEASGTEIPLARVAP